MSADRATGGTAVMASRAPGIVEDDEELMAVYRQIDFFPTPPWAARAGAEIVRQLDPDARKVREGACGAGHMAAPLAEFFPDVRSSDIYPHGFGDELDYLGDADPDDGDPVDWLITNPPFITADQFVRRGLDRARRGVALLLRLQFLEGGERYSLLHGDRPLTLCAPFAERVPMALGKWDPRQGTATGYAWFFWMKGAEPRPLQGIPPGTRDRLWHDDDAARFGWSEPAPLLDWLELVGVEQL